MTAMLKIHLDEGRLAEARTTPSLLITRRVTFAAAHVLRRPEWDADRNEAVFGPCARDHGHNYVLKVSVSGPVDADLDRAIKETLVDHVDHRHLNHDVPFLAGTIPTAENLALAFWDRLDRGLAEAAPGCRLGRLRLVESENNAVEVER